LYTRACLRETNMNDLDQPRKSVLPGLSLEDYIDRDTAIDQMLQMLYVEDGKRKMDQMEWGLIRHDTTAGTVPFIRPKHIRAERLFDSPYSKPAAEKRRGVVLATELAYGATVAGRRRRCTIRRVDRDVICLPAIWEPSATDTGRRLTCCMVAVPAGHLIEHIQEWMAAVIKESDVDTWLEQEFHRERLEALLKPYEGRELIATG
jgi:putative SOS response-associated peptidase YedK